MIFLCALFILTGCGKQEKEPVKVTLFAAKSLQNVMEELIQNYERNHPDVEVVGCYDSSGTLMTQILETDGTCCEIFFSAAQKQMNQLAEEGYLIADSRTDVVNNQVCVVTYQGSSTKVQGLASLSEAESMALADGSVPVGKYTRQALVNMGILASAEDVSSITTKEISKALEELVINECGNVGIVKSAVAEGANEVGTIYYSDLYGMEDKLMILEMVPTEFTGDVKYPIAQIQNKSASDLQKNAAHSFLQYVTSKEAAQVFEAYYFEPLCRE